MSDITKTDMMQVLLDACPSFDKLLSSFLNEWEDEAEKPYYLALADFSRHVIEMLEKSETMTFPKIFEAIEILHTKGDSYVKEAAIIGLLESLQNMNLHTVTKPQQFLPYLGPESTKWWLKVERFWGKGEILKDD